MCHVWDIDRLLSLYIVTISLKCNIFQRGEKGLFFFFSLASLWPQLTLRFGTFSFNLAFVVLWRLCFWTLETWPANFNNVLFYSPAVETSRRLTWWNVTLQKPRSLEWIHLQFRGNSLKGIAREKCDMITATLYLINILFDCANL